MFDSLTEKLEATFKKLRGHGTLTEDNIKDALKEIRRALLEADVNYKVTKDFVNDVHSYGGLCIPAHIDGGTGVRRCFRQIGRNGRNR